MSMGRLAFGIAFLAASSAPVAVAGEPDNGEAVFQARCSDCHEPQDLADWIGQWSDPADRRVRLDGLLRGHYPPTEDERQAIIDYLIAAVPSQ